MTSLNLDTVPRRRTCTFELDQVVVGAGGEEGVATRGQTEDSNPRSSPRRFRRTGHLWDEGGDAEAEEIVRIGQVGSVRVGEHQRVREERLGLVRGW